ncbi:MAG: UDP-N-acetylmuramate dehydrogenase [Candidatus Paceibacterota bacterium]|jgi:UDP-N-acetylmuramate dehydrogenase
MLIKANFPLASITSFKLGGPAKYYLQTSLPEEVLAGILTAKEKKLKYLVLGGGCNMVFPDKGFDGLVIHFTGAKLTPKNFEVIGSKVILPASVNWHEVVKKLASLGLAGTEKMSAIPGNVGGFVVGNAGAYGQFIGDLIEWVEIFDGKEIKKIKKKDCQFGYRDSIFKKKGWIILRVCLRLKKGDKGKLQKEVKEISKLRWAKFGEHPICAGSFFKNVDVKKVPKEILAKIDKTKIIDNKISVGYLIGEAVPKLKVGDIYMAEFHNNFLMNGGAGKTSDLLKLAGKIKQAVKKKFGIELEEEVRYIL